MAPLKSLPSVGTFPILRTAKPTTTTIKWKIGNTSYENVFNILEDFSIANIVEHFAHVIHKTNQVTSEAHRAQSLFKVIVRTIQQEMEPSWNEVVNDDALPVGALTISIYTLANFGKLPPRFIHANSPRHNGTTLRLRKKFFPPRRL